MKPLSQLFSDVKKDVASLQSVNDDEVQRNNAKLRNWMGASNVVVPLYMASLSKLKLGASVNLQQVKAMATDAGQLAFAMLTDALSAGCPVTSKTAPGLYRSQLSASANLLKNIVDTNVQVDTASLLASMRALYAGISNRPPFGFDNHANQRLVKILHDEQSKRLTSLLNAHRTFNNSKNISLLCSLHNFSSTIYSAVSKHVPPKIAPHIPSRAILNGPASQLLDAWLSDAKLKLSVDFSNIDEDALTQFIQNSSKLIASATVAIISDISTDRPEAMMRPDFIGQYQSKMYPLLNQLLETTAHYSRAIETNNNQIYKRLISDGITPSPSRLSYDAWCAFNEMSSRAVIAVLSGASSFTNHEDLAASSLRLFSRAEQLTRYFVDTVYENEVPSFRQQELLQAVLPLVTHIGRNDILADLSDDIANFPFAKPIARAAQLSATATTDAVNDTLNGIDNEMSPHDYALHCALKHALAIATEVSIQQYNRSIVSYMVQSSIAVLGASVTLFDKYIKQAPHADKANSLILFDVIMRTNTTFIANNLKELIDLESGSHVAPLQFLTDSGSVNAKVTADIELMSRRNVISSDFVVNSYSSINTLLQSEKANSVKKSYETAKMEPKQS